MWDSLAAATSIAGLFGVDPSACKKASQLMAPNQTKTFLLKMRVGDLKIKNLNASDAEKIIEALRTLDQPKKADRKDQPEEG